MPQMSNFYSKCHSQPDPLSLWRLSRHLLMQFGTFSLILYRFPVVKYIQLKFAVILISGSSLQHFESFLKKNHWNCTIIRPISFHHHPFTLSCSLGQSNIIRKLKLTEGGDSSFYSVIWDLGSWTQRVFQDIDQSMKYIVTGSRDTHSIHAEIRISL